MDTQPGRVIAKVTSFILSLLLLSNCSFLSPIKTIPTDTFEINSIPSVPVKDSYRETSLTVMPVEATVAYNTSQMAYTLRPYQISYFAKNRWIAPPANMIQPLLVRTLQKTHYFHSVFAAEISGQSDYALYVQILKLQQDFTMPMSVVRLEVRAQLMKVADQRIIATKQFSIVEEAPQNDPYGGVIAANHAVARALKQIAVFCMHSIY